MRSPSSVVAFSARSGLPGPLPGQPRDWQQIAESPPALPKLAITAMLLVPVLYSATYLDANWDPYGKLQNVDAAIVNSDQPVTEGDETVVRAGKDVAAELSTQLRRGAGEVPNPDPAVRAKTADQIGDPLEVQNAAVSSAGNYGAGLAPFFLGLSMWIGSRVLFLLVRPLSNRALASGAPRSRPRSAGGCRPPSSVSAKRLSCTSLPPPSWALIRRTAG